MKIIESRTVANLASLYLAQAGDDPDDAVEFVDTLEPEVAKADKWVMMISTQFGCAVGCRMCDAGAMGYRGNLSAEQIMAQVRHIVSQNPDLDMATHPKVKIHFARIGEPSLNPEVLKALRILAAEFGGPGVIASLSTVAPQSPAVAPFFEELIKIKDAFYSDGRFQLQFSLHATDEQKRNEIVPIKKWSLDQIARYGRRFVGPKDRKITLNFALAPGETIDAGAIARSFSRDKFLIKITPVNPTVQACAQGATHVWNQTPPSIQAGADRLKALGFRVILSPSLPEEISAETSCGQLWSSALKARASVALKNARRQAVSYVTGETLAGKSREWKKILGKDERRRLTLSPGRAGLLVVDMQELFLDPHSPSYLPPARAILLNVRRLVDQFRAAGRPVYFTYHAHEDPEQDGGLMTVWWKRVCVEGTPGAKISQILEPGKGLVFRKYRYNAFSQPALEQALIADKISELVVCGVATNLCVESTVRDAFDKGLKTFVVLDAAAARAEDLHLASLKNLAHGFSTLLTADEVLAAYSF